MFMENIEIPFDDPANYTFESGLEVAGSSLRLIDPTGTTYYAAYFKIELPEDNIASVTVDSSFDPSMNYIPMSIWSEEPSFEDILGGSGELKLSDLWTALNEKGQGTWYIGVVLGGSYKITNEFPPANTLAYWSFDTDVRESQGKGVDGILVGNTAPTTGKHNGAYTFDGNDYINMGTYLGHRVTGDQTICMWVYPYSTNTARRNPWNKAYGGEGTITMETTGILNYFYGIHGGDAAPYQTFGSVKPLVPNVWQHITVVRDLTNMALYWYVDAVQTNSAVAQYTSAAISSAALLIGDGYVNGWHGKIDEVLLFDRALGPGEVQTVYNQLGDGESTVPSGPMSINNISIVFESDGTYAGNVINEKVYSYLGNMEQDTLIHLENITEAASDYSNILLTQDRIKLDYIIINEGSGEADIVVKTLSMQENIIVSINDSFDASWSCDSLMGNGLDFRVNKGVSGSGEISSLTDSWEMRPSGKFATELSNRTDMSSLYTMAVIRKDSPNIEDTARFQLKVGNTIFDIVFDDREMTMTTAGTTFGKPDLPWLTKYVNFTVRTSDSMTLFQLNGQTVYRGAPIDERAIASIEFINGSCNGQLKSFYHGPLSVGESEDEDLDNLEKKLIVSGPTTCTGSLFLAGNQKLDSVGQIYIVSTYVYLDDKIYCRTPGFFLEDPVILGLRDAVTGTEVIYYGSQTEYGIYIYKDGYWSLFEPGMRLFSIWRSRHTEGLVMQREGESSIKIYLFKRDKVTNELVYNKDIAMTGLPEGEDKKYKFEPSMDRRLSQKTTPWVWAEDKSLSS